MNSIALQIGQIGQRPSFCPHAFRLGPADMSKRRVCCIVRVVVIEKVFVTSGDLSAALDPAGRAPATAVRRLREAGFISHGIELRPYRRGRLRGGAVYYCALNLDAAESVRDGDEATARKLARAAAAIESTANAQELAKALVEVHDLRGLPGEKRRAASRLAARITRERRRLAHSSGPMLGLVVATDDRFATVDTDEELVVLPRETLGLRGLDWPGAAVAIRSHRLRTGALVHSADEALALDDGDRHGARPFDPFAMRQERRGQAATAAINAALAGREPVRLVAPLVVAR
jgi:hypothetical protein